MEDHPRRSTRRHNVGFALALALGLLLLVGCTRADSGADVASLAADTGNDGEGADNATGTTVPPASTDPAEAARAFAKCMREHGVEMPDPQVGEDGGMTMQIGTPDQAPPDRSVLDEAHKACEPLMKNARGSGPGKLDPEQEARMKEEALQFAKCMREHGVDMPDPTFEEGGGVVMVAGGDDPGSATSREAMEACQQFMKGPDGKPLEGPMVAGGDGPSGGAGAVVSSGESSKP